MEDLILNLYEIDDGEQWIYCAESKDEALKMYLELLVSPIPENLDEIDDSLLPIPLKEIEVSKLDNTKMLSVANIEGPNGDITVEKTVFEWSLEGKGCVCSTVW